jgi:hypothetical protein
MSEPSPKSVISAMEQEEGGRPGFDVEASRALLQYLELLDPEHILSQDDVIALFSGTGKFLADEDRLGEWNKATPLQRLYALEDSGYDVESLKRSAGKASFRVASEANINSRLRKVMNRRLEFAGVQQRILAIRGDATDSDFRIIASEFDTSQLSRFCRVVASVGGARRHASDVVLFLGKFPGYLGFDDWEQQLNEIEGVISRAHGKCMGEMFDFTRHFHDFDGTLYEGIQRAVEPVLLSVLDELIVKIVDFTALRVPGEQDECRIGEVKRLLDKLRTGLPSVAQIHAGSVNFYPDVSEAGKEDRKCPDYGVIRHLFGGCLHVLGRLRDKLTELQGFDQLDKFCMAAPSATSLQLFALEWLRFRRLTFPPAVSDLATAIITEDVRGLGKLIGGSDVNGMKIAAHELPSTVLRWRYDPASLLEVASSVGGDSVRYLLEFHHQVPGHRCLCQAVAFGDPETIRTLWDRMGEEERVANPEVLRIAMEFHHREMAMWLVAQQPSWYLIAMTFGILNECFYLVEGMPSLKAEEITRPSQDTFDEMVYDAVKRDDETWLKTAIVLGGSPDATVALESGRSPSAIVLAASRENTRMIRCLLMYGADVDWKGGGLKTALTACADELEPVRLLLSWGASPNAGCAGLWHNPLGVAAAHGAVECVRLMIKQGADPSRVDETGNVLHWALRSDSLECVRLLLKHGADPNAVVSGSGDTPMHVFARQCGGGDSSQLIMLLEVMRKAGALPVENYGGMSPLELARANTRMPAAVREWFEEWSEE